jgi:hypothetical protein
MGVVGIVIEMRGSLSTVINSGTLSEYCDSSPDNTEIERRKVKQGEARMVGKPMVISSKQRTTLVLHVF